MVEKKNPCNVSKQHTGDVPHLVRAILNMVLFREMYKTPVEDGLSRTRKWAGEWNTPD